uniref:nuclear pore complex protein Nup205 isoform X2 n=1 Tax=Myxine glutinosa TaxID=7769 RepID=UPI00358F7403
MAAPLAANSVTRLWNPYKDVRQAVENAVHEQLPDSLHKLATVLRKHKPDFLSLFNNPAKNPQHRERLKKANIEGISIHGQQGLCLLSSQLVEEALVLSDMFDLNEIAALELLLAAQDQQPHMQNYAHGLVAVLLYWDGKAAIASALRSLILARRGRTWTLGLSEELVALATHFTDELMEEGLTRKVLELVESIDFNTEFEKLRRDRGLGNERHRKQVSDLIKDSRQNLAECLYVWACQSPLTKADTLLLVEHLQHTSLDGEGRLDGPSLALLMALLYCFGTSEHEHVFDHQEDSPQSQVLQHRFPVMERSYMQAIHGCLVDAQPWTVPGLQAVVRLAWSLVLRSVSQLPESAALGEFIEADEAMLDLALSGGVFLFLRESVITTEAFYQDDFYIRRVHALITDFIALMPLKVKQLRNRADEEARIMIMNVQMGSETPQGCCDLEQLMMLAGELYSKDPFGLELALDFWCPVEPLQGPGEMGSFLSIYQPRPMSKEVSLSKFVRQTGDLLPPSLYLPYLCMLRGLANGSKCAHYCFNLLKTNGTGIVESIQGMSGGIVSWEHFFHSLHAYHEHLKREVPSMETQPFRTQPAAAPKNIIPRELEGLRAVLKLTATIAQQCESARLSLYEHPQWMPLVTVLGLMQCSIPPLLKAELLNTVSAFAGTAEIAASLWQAIEMAQILETVKVPNMRQSSGIEMELNEIESRLEEYPMTRAFCGLLNALIHVCVPENLGAGLRAPGFEPYLTFIRDSVFVKFPSRAYRDPAEKWQVAELALGIFQKLLYAYEPQLEDFGHKNLGEASSASSLPGYTIMIHLLTESPMLNLCLNILEEGICLLDTFSTFPGKSSLEGALQYCLALLGLALQKEGAFMAMSQANLLVTPLELLLQAVNPQSKNPDHLINIARFVCHGFANPGLARESTKILWQVCQYPNIQSRLVGDFTQNKSIGEKMLAGFVECLEMEDMRESSTAEEECQPAALGELGTRANILNLLLCSLEHKSPNVALFLFGFELRKPASSTNLQDAGVLKFPKTCLHSIIAILSSDSDQHSTTVGIGSKLHIIELCYQVIYQLCTNPDTSGPTMRYLRTGKDFLYQQLQHLPFQSTEGNSVLVLNQMAWLLRTIAVEIRVASMHRQRSYLHRLLRLLLGSQVPSPSMSEALSIAPLLSQGSEPDRNSAEELDNYMLFGELKIKGHRKLVSVLEAIDFVQPFPEDLQLDILDRTQLEKVIESCEERSVHGASLCNVKKLKNIIMGEMNKLQGLGAIGHRSVLLNEVRTVLEHVLERNRSRKGLQSKLSCLEAWRQVMETVLASCPTELLQGEERQMLITDLLYHLFQKILHENVAAQLMPLASGALFTLCTHLSQFARADSPWVSAGNQCMQITSLFDPLGAVGQPAISGLAAIGADSLLLVLKNLLDFIMKTGGSYQRVRTSLYGAMLYYLQITQTPDVPDTLEAGRASMWDALTTAEDEYGRLRRENVKLINSYGPPLLEIVCRDACDGPEIGRMLALAILEQILRVDRHQQWLTYFSNSGYLPVLVESLARDDPTLQGLLIPQPPSLKALYIYESKMAFLTCLAQSSQGASELLRVGVLTCLVHCRMFSLRPEPNPYHVQAVRESESFIPSTMERYRQLLIPALQLCSALLTSLAGQQRRAASQVMQFLVVHGDAVHAVLRCQEVNLGALQEISLLTSIMSQTALPEFLMGMDFQGNALLEIKGHLERMQRQTLGLLTKICSQEMLRKVRELDNEAQSNGLGCRDEAQLAVQQICAHLMEYCYKLMVQSSPSLQHTFCLFTPSFAEAMGQDSIRRDDAAVASVPGWKLSGLGVLMCLIREASNSFQQAYDGHRQNLQKFKGLEQLSVDEIRKLSQPLLPVGVEKLSAGHRQHAARRRLIKMVNYNAQFLALSNYTLETCLFIMWRHLQFYCVHCVPVDPYDPHPSVSSHLRPRHLQGIFVTDHGSDLQTAALSLTRVTRQDVEQLLGDAATCFTEAVQKKLQDIESNYCKVQSRYTFIQALSRRIRRLITLKRPASCSGSA